MLVVIRLEQFMIESRRNNCTNKFQLEVQIVVFAVPMSIYLKMFSLREPKFQLICLRDDAIHSAFSNSLLEKLKLYFQNERRLVFC